MARGRERRSEVSAQGVMGDVDSFVTERRRTAHANDSPHRRRTPRNHCFPAHKRLTGPTREGIERGIASWWATLDTYLGATGGDGVGELNGKQHATRSTECRMRAPSLPISQKACLKKHSLAASQKLSRRLRSCDVDVGERAVRVHSVIHSQSCKTRR